MDNSEQGSQIVRFLVVINGGVAFNFNLPAVLGKNSKLGREGAK